MYTIDNEKFGTFLSQLRRDRGMTQKDLAERLFVSDKAVSKWERGLSLPDVSLLQPLADIMGVTISELLSGRRIPSEEPLTVRETDQLVSGTLALTAEAQEERRQSRRRWGGRYAAALLLGGGESLLLWRMGYGREDWCACLWTILLLGAVFGLWFCFFLKERLPAFYDGNRISFVSDGAFRMNVPGVHFNNSNWPHIVRVGRVWSLAVMGLWPLVYLAAMQFSPAGLAGGTVMLCLTLALTLGGLFLPMVVVGRKYE